MEPSDFSTLGEVVRQETCDFNLPPFEGIVHMRAAQVLDALPLSFELTPDDMERQRLVFMAVTIAYRLGLKDGLIRLGELA